jgi:hypothetical protein
MSRRWSDVGRALAGVAVALVVSLVAATAGATSPAPRVPGGLEGVQEPGVQAYKGKLVDESGKPISGIFPVTFKLYPGLKAKKPVWSETMWVAVDRGVYTVHLGVAKPLPARDDLNRMVLGVDVKGVGELVREPFVPADVRPPVLTAGAQKTPGVPQGAPIPMPPQAGKSGATGAAKYADTAGYAVEADHAKNSDRLMNLTVDDIVRRAAEEGGGGGGAAAAQTGTKVRIGSSKRYGAQVGGTGGAEYNEVCPKGYVMVGMRGAAANLVDSFQIICAPLE